MNYEKLALLSCQYSGIFSALRIYRNFSCENCLFFMDINTHFILTPHLQNLYSPLEKRKSHFLQLSISGL